MIAEDLGLITEDVEELRDALGFPGMVVLLWAFQAHRRAIPTALENHRLHQVVYTTTHDTDDAARPLSGPEPWTLIELALSSRAALSDDSGTGRAPARQRGTHEHGPASRSATGRGGSRPVS